VDIAHASRSSWLIRPELNAGVESLHTPPDRRH
jgi:hypothetical protein